MDNFRTRLFYEHLELGQRINKLKAFIDSDEYKTLPDVDRLDLQAQYSAMLRYYEILDRRTARLLK